MKALGLTVKLEAAPKGKRLIVCGGREYKDRARLFQVLDLLAPSEIAQGEGLGADRLAKEWAEERGIPCARFRALWEVEGRPAGSLRNRRMFQSFEPDGVVAFPGGEGTADMERVTIDGGAWLVKIR
jgi:hypothetical protein